MAAASTAAEVQCPGEIEDGFMGAFELLQELGRERGKRREGGRIEIEREEERKERKERVEREREEGKK